MDANTMYYGGLVVIAILGWMSYQNNRMFSTLLLMALAAYLIYSHNTGNTITDFTDKAVKELDKQL
jgi:hypothetical protein